MYVESEMKRSPSEWSPDTVLPQRDIMKNVKRSMNRSSQRDDALEVKKGFTEISFLKYYNFSPSGFFELPIKQPSKYSAYDCSSRKSRNVEGNARRKKIEMSCNSDVSFFIKAVDCLYNDDEVGDEYRQTGGDPCTSGEYIEFRPTFGEGRRYMLTEKDSYLSTDQYSNWNHTSSPSFSSSRSSSKSRFSPVRKILDPFSKSRNQRCHLEKKDPYQTSPVHLQGFLKVDNHHGIRSYEFSMITPEQVYVAKTRKSENGFNRLYTFHSMKRRNGSILSSSSGSKDSPMVALMKVSCNIRSNLENETSLVTEFVLYDISHARRSLEQDDSFICSSEIMQPGFEIAAMVVEVPFAKHTSLLRQTMDEKILNQRMLEQDSKKMQMIIPNGHHSLGNEDSQGPSSLLDRWKFGNCDCGGWDMACSLTVLTNFEANLNDHRHLELYVMGKKQEIPALAIASGESGQLSVNFHAQLSAVQAFSTCVALLHTTEASHSVAAIVEEAKEMEMRRKLQRKQEQIRPLYVDNPPFSPMSRV